MCDFVKNLFTKDWDLDDKILMVTVAALAGALAGILISPLKQGISVMSHNGCNNNGNGTCQKEDKDKEKKDKKKECCA
ncbi:MAG: hypothetical protein Q4F05_06230 [bacterium]|nr:hypothetical protein [bacterium]